MSKIKEYGLLLQKQYISVQDQGNASYGGNQEWFPKKGRGLKSSLIHHYGCGVIALTDLFLYWALTLKDGKDTLAGQYIDEHGKITKEKYMALVEEVRTKYAFIFGRAGTFAFQLTMAINRYIRENHIDHEAKLDLGLGDLTMLKRIQTMLNSNQPVILMIGHSFPILNFSKIKKGVPFYRQRLGMSSKVKGQHEPYAKYELVKKGAFGHFVTITDMIIDEHPEHTHEHIMLKITSWGNEYYISYHHLRRYINTYSTPYLSAIITIE